jgi:hypothetical protein
MSSSIQHTAQLVLQFLQHPDLKDHPTAQLCIKLLEDCKSSAKSHSTDLEGLLRMAKESEKTEFKIIARMNNDGPGYHVFGEWADDARNFAFMCTNEKEDIEYKDGDYLKRTYTLDELPQALINANQWYDSVKSRNQFWTESIHILAVK